jgi:FkbM family methyltransferase
MPAPDRDRWDFWAKFEAGEWEPDTLTLIDRYVGEHGALLDIGAWIGPLSLYACSKGGRAIAVEPDPIAAFNLERNVMLNSADVYIVEAALAAEKGKVTIFPAGGRWGDSMTRVSDKGTQVPAVTIDEFDLTGVTLAKMDVEGYEVELLPNVAPYLAEREIPLLVSWHEPWWPRSVDLAERRSWFRGYHTLGGDMAGWSQLLAIP